MKVRITIAALTGHVLCHDFEPADFNIASALSNNGVNFSNISSFGAFNADTHRSGCAVACDALKLIFGDDRVETQEESAYQAFMQEYWSAQQKEIMPQCIFKPTEPTDVSTCVLIARITQCPFAAKSGGHSAVPGGSIGEGIVISFEMMRNIILSSDKKTVSFQPGLIWSDVYNALEKDNVTVIGGRVADVGVGGLTLGGGMSYFSNMYGLACDNVLAFELVTASGVIITVTERNYPDLYWALRGGGNNFGLVTRFEVEAIPRAPLMWGGVRQHLPADFPALLNAHYHFAVAAEHDPKGHATLSFIWTAGLGILAIVELDYADPIANAPIMDDYNAIRNNSVGDQTGIKSLGQVLDSSRSGHGLRQSFWTFTIKLDEHLPSAIKDIFFDKLPELQDVEGMLASITFQAFTEPMLKRMSARGGNALGLTADEPLRIVLMAFWWNNASDDQRIAKFCAGIRSKGLALAEAVGKASRYTYMNYASPWEDVIAGYGPESKTRLRSISKKYDPTGVFQLLQPGYFKLEGPPRAGL